MGLCRLLNFGHVAFMAIGAYTTILLSTYGIPLAIAVLSGMILAGFAGAFLGVATLKLREDYLAIVTIGFGEILRHLLQNEAWLTRGSFGLYGYPRPFEELVGPQDYNLFLAGMVIILLGIVYIFLEVILRSPWGRALRSIRDDEAASASLAISDRGYILEMGRNRFQGPAKSLLDDADVERLYLGAR